MGDLPIECGADHLLGRGKANLKPGKTPSNKEWLQGGV